MPHLTPNNANKNISLIYAQSLNKVIGKNNQLPWHLPNDLQFFKQKTLNKSIIMGRKTFESLKKALPKRQNIVMSRHKFSAPNCQWAKDLNHAIELAQSDEIMIIGGANIFQQSLNLASKIYLTQIEAEIDGDSFAPEIDFSKWEVIEKTSHPADEKHEFAYTFMILQTK